MQGRVAGADFLEVGLEVLDVDGVETDDGCVEADVGFADLVAEVVGARGGGQVLFGAV